MTEYKKNNINLFIFIFCLIFFFTKWYHPFVNFNEGIESKIIFESVSDGYHYFVPFKALANLNLNSSFDPLIKNHVVDLIRPLSLTPVRHSKYLTGLAMFGLVQYL